VPCSTLLSYTRGLIRGRTRIAIAGTFGTGLFLNSGYVLATAGPAGALIAYILVGSVSYA
jgi:amino acid permease